MIETSVIHLSDWPLASEIVHLEPFQLDFLVSRRLDYLHIFFLLHLISLNQVTEPNEGILTVAGEMLLYAVEVVILHNRLVNSGTSIIGKVIFNIRFSV